MRPLPQGPIGRDQLDRILDNPLPTYRRAAVIATTGEGSVIAWNEAAERLYGWRRSEAMSQSIIYLTAPVQSADKAAEIMAFLQAGRTWTGDVVLRRRNGLPLRIFVMDFPLGDLAHGRGVIVGVSVPAAQRRGIAGHETRIEAELHRRAYGTHRVRLPIAQRANDPWGACGSPMAPERMPRGYEPIKSIRRIGEIHNRLPLSNDPWRLMQRIETYRYRAETLTGKGRFVDSGRARLAQMWLGLADRLHARSISLKGDS